jgi:Flp pilus assembly protein TadD
MLEPAPPVSPPPARARQGAAFLVAVALAAITLFVYAGALRHTFVNWDDPEYVTQNPLVLGKEYGRLLTAVVSHHYHPLTMLSLAWNVSTPLSAQPFIATNVALHVINTLLVFWLVLLLAERRVAVAAFVALLFGIHPMHVESVAWIAERKDVLYAAFYLGGLIAYWGHLERSRPPLLILTFALFVLACLAKGIAVTFPLAMLLLDYWKGRPLQARLLLEKLPFLAVSALFGAVVLDVQAGGDFHGLLDAPAGGTAGFGLLPGYTPLQRVALPAYACLMYVWRLLVPAGLMALHPYPHVGDAGQLRFVLAPVLLLLLVLIAARSARRHRAVAFGAGWYLVSVIPVLQWIPVGGSLMAERYTYLPYVGLLFILATGLAAAAARGRWLGVAAWGAAGVFAAAMMLVSIRQVETWKNSESLWSRAIQVRPGLATAYVYRGKDREASGRVPEAHADFRAAEHFGARTPDVYEGLGSTWAALGRPDSAAVMFDRAVRADPTRGRSYYNRAVVRLQLGRSREAVADLDTALALLPDQATKLLGVRGYLKSQLGDCPGAIADLDRAIAAGARDPGVRYSRGNCRLTLGDRAGAVEDFRATLRLAPGHAKAAARLKELGL